MAGSIRKPVTRGHRPDTRPKLSREAILDAAVDLVDRDGGAALTMRRLGAELGVEAMSLYHHVGSRSELLDGLVNHLASQMPAAAEDLDWEAAVRAFATSIRNVALAHPRAFELVGMRPLQGQAALTVGGRLLERLRSAGIPPQECVTVLRLTVALARGFSLGEISGLTFAGPSDDGRDLDVPEELAQFRGVLVGDQDRVFDEALDLVVAGIKARQHGRRRRTRPRPAPYSAD